jgi:penicillin-binding protein 1A
VWFVGFTSNIVAGCYIGYDQPRSLGRGASGGGMCGPVFNAFMQKAVEKFGGSAFQPPESCQFIKIDRNTGARLSDEASGENVVAECFREGEEPIFGIQFDGGFAMGSNFELYTSSDQTSKQVTTSSGGTATVGPKASFGTLSSGGLY